MSNKFQPKDKHLQQLIKDFEESVRENKPLLIHEEEIEKLIGFYESLPEYEKALSAIEKALDLYPYSSIFYLKQAQLLIDLDRPDEAWASLHQARVFEPQSPELLLLEADLLSDEGRYDEAIETLKQLEEISPDEHLPDLYLEFADIYEAAGNVEQLEEMLAYLLLHYPSNEEAVHRYWSFISSHQRIEEGLNVFQQNVDARPYNFLAWYYLGKSYEAVGLYEKAIDAFEYSIAINDYYFCYWDYAQCLQNASLFDKAISTYFEMLELFDQDVNIYFEIGACYQSREESVKARKAYLSVIDLTGDLQVKAKAHYLIGKSFENDHRFELALTNYRKATELHKRKTKYLNATARVCFQLEEYEQAADLYIQSLAIHDEQATIWCQLAAVYYHLQLPENLLDVLGKSIQLLPSNATVHYHYAAYLLHYGYSQEGLLQLEKALILDSTRKNSIFALFPALENKIEVLELLGQFEE